MKTRTSTLPNGLLVVTVEMPGIELATAAAFVRAGARNEELPENGVAHFLEHMAFKGTKTRTSLDIALEVEKLGSVINAWTSHNRTAYHVTGLTKNIGASVRIIGDVLTASNFPKAPLEIERGVILQEIARSADSAEHLAYHALTATAYPGQSMGRTILGDAEFVKRASPDDFQSFVNRFYTADNMILIGAGGITHAEFLRHATEAFGGLPSGSALAPEAPRYSGGYSGVGGSRFEQVNIFLGFEAVPLPHANSLAHRMLPTVVGGGMSSPLFQEIRAKRGLVYSVGAFSTHGRDYGLFGVHAGTTPDHVEELLKVACQELLKAADGIDPEDLARTKNSWEVAVASAKVSTVSVATHLAERHFSFGDLDLPGAARQELDALTPAQVSQAAREVLQSRAVIALAGPAPEVDFQAVVASALG